MKSFVWHPYTQMKDWTEFDVITKGKGMWLYNTKGKSLMDGVASMWCNVWGHSYKELTNAMIKQTKTLQHSSLFNLTNDKAEILAKELIQIAPEMYRVFYSDDGSTAMEIAAKMALQYWHNIGIKKKTKFVSLENGYHGDTSGTMSLGYVPSFFSKFKPLLFSVIRTPSPNRYRMPKGFTFEDYQEYCIEKIEKTFTKNDNIAAFVMESGAQIAGGVVIYPEGFQRKISKICKKNDVLFVLDEIATGFGRLGSMVEYQTQNSTPDIVSFGKMMSGGYIPIAATLANKKVYDSFLGEYQDMKHLFHGHTYTGNPLACATAIANIALYKKKKLMLNVRKRSEQLQKKVNEILDIDIVGDVRSKGLLMGIELVSDKKLKTPILPKKRISQKIFQEAKKHGIYQRTLGNIVMIIPPLAITGEELDYLLDGTIKTIKNVSAQV